MLTHTENRNERIIEFFNFSSTLIQLIEIEQETSCLLFCHHLHYFNKASTRFVKTRKACFLKENKRLRNGIILQSYISTNFVIMKPSEELVWI